MGRCQWKGWWKNHWAFNNIESIIDRQGWFNDYYDHYLELWVSEFPPMLHIDAQVSLALEEREQTRAAQDIRKTPKTPTLP